MIKPKHILPLILFLSFTVLPFYSRAQLRDLSPAQKKIYYELISLRLPIAKKMLFAEKSNPQSGRSWNIYLNDLYDFLNIIVNQDEKLYESAEPEIEKRLRQLQTTDKNSPEYLFIYGEILFHRSMLRLQFNHYIKGGLDFRKGYQSFAENEKKFPNWLPNKKSLGLYHLILGTIPDEFQWFNQLLGMEGTRNLGMKEISLSMGDASVFHLEAQIIYPMLLSFLDIDNKRSVEMAKKIFNKDKNNLLMLYVTAIILQKEGYNEDALHVLENFQGNENYAAFNYIYYMKADCQRNKGEYEQSILNFNKYIENAKEKEEKASATYQVALCYWLLNNEKQALELKDKICKDEEFIKENENYADFCKRDFPNRILLSSRYCFDGGYYEKAETLLQNSDFKVFNPSHNLPSKENHLEYLYRLGRIYQKQKLHAKAVSQFHKLLTLYTFVKESKTYFIPYSCFQTGNVFAELGIKDSAKYYYEKALTYKKFSHEKSLQYEVKQKLKELQSEKK